MGKGARSAKVGDLIHRGLVKLIRETSDEHNLGMVTVSGVVVTDDLLFAKVYVTVLESDKQVSTVASLNNLASFYRTQLARQLTLRVVPKMRFYYDESLNVGLRIDQLLDSIKDRNVER